jgi:peptide/nickel transport system permease protein
LGRDAFSRVLHGGWVLLLLALASTVLGVAIGAVAGMVAAYRPGWGDTAIMRSTDVFLTIPPLVFGLLLVSIVGPYLWLVVVAVALTHAPQVARVIRAASIEIAERDYVKASELWGYSNWTVIRREILPNLTTPLMVEAGLRLSYSIIIIAGLSYLGFGEQPPTPDWGQMINDNRLGLGTNPWPVFVPCVLIALLAVGTNTFTDAIARVSLGIDRGEAAVLRATTAQAIEPGLGDD